MRMFRLLLLSGTGAATFCRAYQQQHPLVPAAPTRVLCRRSARASSAIDVEPDERSISVSEREQHHRSDEARLLRLKDVVPISIFALSCLLGAVAICGYEAFDVSSLRPSPSTLRRRAPTFRQPNSGALGFMRSATMGMGWGKSNRAVEDFSDWYGTSAATSQNLPSYNEIMLEHRSERIPRWNRDTSAKLHRSSLSRQEIETAVLQLYKSIDELDTLKALADDYQWERMKELLSPERVDGVQASIDFSLDVLRASPQLYQDDASRVDSEDLSALSEVVGFDWGSCAWRYCGAKADAQEALAELYSSTGMLEPFECRFVIDIVERSLRDILSVVPDEFRPPGANLKPYVPYISQAAELEEAEYIKASSLVKEVDFYGD